MRPTVIALLLAPLCFTGERAHARGGQLTVALKTPKIPLVKRARARAGRAKRPRRPRGKRPRVRPQQLVGWGTQEAMTFRASLAGVDIGRAALVLGRPGSFHSRRAVIARGRSETTPALSVLFKLREDLHTVIDLAGLLPLRSTLTARRSGRVKTTVTEHGTTRAGPTVQRIKRGRSRGYRRLRRVPRVHFDPLSALLQLRSMPLSRRLKKQFTVLTTSKIYRVKIEVRGPEQVRHEGSLRRAIRIDGEATRLNDAGRAIPGKHKRFTLWLSDDAARVPLRATATSRWGTLSLRLTSYRPPAKRLRVGVVRL